MANEVTNHNKSSRSKNRKIFSVDIPIIGSILKYIRENIGIIVACIALFVLMAFASDNFFTWNNWVNILRQISVNYYLAIGIMLCIIITGIDLSVGSVLAVSGVVCAGLITNNGLNPLLAMGAGLIIGIIFGFFNGSIIAFTNMPPFVVTLATMSIGRGAAYLYTNGSPIRVENELFEQVGLGYLGPLPLPVVYSIILLFMIYYLTNQTKLGRYIYAVGGNKQAALYAGINVKKVTIIVYTISGLMAAFAGVILTSRLASASPNTGIGYEADAVAAAVLGGTSMVGGEGKIGGMVLGAVLLGMLNNGLNLMGLNSFWQFIAKGAVILLAVYVDMVRKNKRT